MFVLFIMTVRNRGSSVYIIVNDSDSDDDNDVDVYYDCVDVL